jgi:CheY-like chemotaxis protein
MATGSGETTLQVAVIEDLENIRDGLRILIDHTPGFRCLAACPDMEHPLDLFARAAPQVALVDIGLPGISGIDGTRILKERFPKLQVIILTRRRPRLSRAVRGRQRLSIKEHAARSSHQRYSRGHKWRLSGFARDRTARVHSLPQGPSSGSLAKFSLHVA